MGAGISVNFGQANGKAMGKKCASRECARSLNADLTGAARYILI
jgi:hypothetical protein